MRVNMKTGAYGNDLTNDTDRFTSCVRKEITADRQNFSIHLIGPSGVVSGAMQQRMFQRGKNVRDIPKNGNAMGNVNIVRVFEGFTIIECFQGGYVSAIAFDEISQLVEQSTTSCGILSTWSAVDIGRVTSTEYGPCDAIQSQDEMLLWQLSPLGQHLSRWIRKAADGFRG